MSHWLVPPIWEMLESVQPCAVDPSLAARGGSGGLLGVPCRVADMAQVTPSLKGAKEILSRVHLAWEELRDLVGTEPRHRRLHARILMVIFVTIVLDLAVAAALTLFDSPGSALRGHPLHSFIWTSSQILAGGASYAPGERAHICEPFLELYAVTVIAALAGAFGSFFASKPDDPSKPDDSSRLL